MVKNSQTYQERTEPVEMGTNYLPYLSTDSEEAAPMHRPPVPNITPSDIVIGVMGVTGVGKSTFISYFNDAALAGDSLESCTVNVGIFEVSIDGRKIFLIDTPGFDDTNRNDTEILREVADWLNQSYKAHIKLAGIIYLHRIQDNRMTGASMKNLRMFKKLCGDGGLSCVVLATTMWPAQPTAKEIEREQQLVSTEAFWAGMIKKGSTVFRQDDGMRSAIRIIQFILQQRHRITLKIQEQMAQGKTLDETDAGMEVQAEIARMKEKHEREMRDLREEMLEAQRNNDRAAQAEIASLRIELDAKMHAEEQKREQLRVTIEELHKQREQEIREERERIYEQELEHREAMWKAKSDLEALRAKGEHEAQLLEARYESRSEAAELKRLREAEERYRIAELRFMEAEERKRKADNDGGCVIL